MLAVNVTGGTDAGHRIVRPLPWWLCNCTATLAHAHDFAIEGEINGAIYRAAPGSTKAQRTHPGDRYSCPDCGARRP